VALIHDESLDLCLQVRHDKLAGTYLHPTYHASVYLFCHKDSVAIILPDSPQTALYLLLG